MESSLFDPFEIRGMRLGNRFVRSATAERMADDRGVPDERVEALYRRLGEGGVGLIVTGHAFVHQGGRCHGEMTGAHTDGLVEPLAGLVRAAHAGGAAVALQINHGGRACDPSVVEDPVAPSAVPPSGDGPTPRAMDVDDIGKIVEAFGAAARRAKDAGFDAVQIHGAHGYLVSQFLSPLANRRDDAYGGSLSNRARFLKEVAAVVRSSVGPDFPVLVKLGVTDNLEGGLTTAEGAEVASWLQGFGIDAVETSTGGAGAMQTRITRPEREAYLLETALAVREKTEIPVILVGGLRSLVTLEQVLNLGIDLVSLSRPLIREPDLPRKLETLETEKAACVSCNRCWPKAAGDGIACKAKK
jgi:2,4-dienoyl-CoA reductase-like NADH-dependent reductase (Old Yellow Enzyme family)